MSAIAAVLPGGRLHLQHGPIDLILGADGNREAAFAKAKARFANLLDEIVAELPALRRPLGGPVAGIVPRRMAAAVAPHTGFVTPMAAVAGAVADEVLAAMRDAGPRRAYANNGGDIALHLSPGLEPGERFTIGLGLGAGQVSVCAEDGIGGIATSGRGGRSLSLGIADAVTVLAASAAAADAAATLIANAVDLPGHPAIQRRPAAELQDDSDLGDRLAVTGLGPLTTGEVADALARGVARAETMRQNGLIRAAALFLRGQTRLIGLPASQVQAA